MGPEEDLALEYTRPKWDYVDREFKTYHPAIVYDRQSILFALEWLRPTKMKVDAAVVFCRSLADAWARLRAEGYEQDDDRIVIVRRNEHV